MQPSYSLIWATGSVPDAPALLPMWAGAKWRGWWIQLHDDAMIRNHIWHVSTWEPPCQGGWGRAWQVFFFTFSPAATYFYAAHHSATDLTLDKWRWQERIICSNITSASLASTTALLSLKSGANTLSQADESRSAWLKVCSLILMKNRSNVAPLLFFSNGTVWSIHFHPQSPIVFVH